MHHPTDMITHITAFVTPVVENWLEREIAQRVHPMKDRSDDPSHHERTLLPRSYIKQLKQRKTITTIVKVCTEFFFFFFLVVNYVHYPVSEPLLNGCETSWAFEPTLYPDNPPQNQIPTERRITVNVTLIR